MQPPPPTITFYIPNTALPERESIVAAAGHRDETCAGFAAPLPVTQMWPSFLWGKGSVFVGDCGGIFTQRH